MRYLVIAFLLITLVPIACSSDKKAKERDPVEQQNSDEVGLTETQGESAPKAGFDALKDIKEIRNEEHKRQQEEKEITETIEDQ